MRKSLNISNTDYTRLENTISDEFYTEYIRNACLVILLYNDDEKTEDIIAATGLSRRTIFNYIKKYKEYKGYNGFINYLNGKKKKIIKSPLQNYFNEIAKDFYNSYINTYDQARTRIQELTGIKISENRLRIFFRNNDIKKIDGRYVPTKSLLYIYAKEIEDYIYTLPTMKTKEIIKRIKIKYPMITENTKEIREFIKTNTSL